jgi:predicted acetyltransferase
MEITYEEVRLAVASKADKPLLFRLLQLYEHDLSAFTGADLNPDGIYESRYFDRYWSEQERIPMLICWRERTVGFALVRQLEAGPSSWQVAEYFILKKYRRSGIGSRAAILIFDRWGPFWEVRELENNPGARSFWLQVIGEYTSGRFQERRDADFRIPRWVQTFEKPV